MKNITKKWKFLFSLVIAFSLSEIGTAAASKIGPSVLFKLAHSETIELMDAVEPLYSVQSQITKIENCCATVNVRVTMTANGQEYLVANANYFVSLYEGDCCLVQGFDPSTDPKIFEEYTSNEVLKLAIDEAIATKITNQNTISHFETNEKSVIIYPNPVAGHFKVELPEIADPWVLYFIYDSQGRVQYGPGNQNVENQVLAVTLPEMLTSGTYFIRIFADKEWKVIKFTVE